MEKRTEKILDEVKKVIVGKDETVKKVFMAILARGHVLLEDVPGVGKTTLALSFGRALGLDCKRIQFNSDTLPSDVTGFSVYDKESGSFKYQPGPVMTNLLLADEINRTSSKTQGALLEVMEEKQVTVDSVTHRLPEPFTVLATQNPVGSAGTQLLPPSQLDRFMIKLSMGYPSFESHVDMLMNRHSENPLDKVECVISKQELIGLSNEVSEVFISKPVYEYVTALAEASRRHGQVELGISPRGALALCAYAKAQAFVSERTFVTPEDVCEVFSSVCAHRIIPDSKARISGVSCEDIASEIVRSVPFPKITVEA